MPIRWVGSRDAIGAGPFAPVEIAAGVLGAVRRLRVSQQHRILLTGPRAELLFGEAEVFVPALHLVNGRDIRLIRLAAVEYFHILLERHQVIEANGLASESLHLGANDATDATLFFPQLRDMRAPDLPLARRSLRRHEVGLLLAGQSLVEPQADLRHIA